MAAVVGDRIESAAHAYSIAAQPSSEFAGGAAARDFGRAFAEVDRLAASGSLAITVLAAFGGADVPPSAVAEVVRMPAVADLNIAQVPHSHFVYLNLLRGVICSNENENEKRIRK